MAVWLGQCWQSTLGQRNFAHRANVGANRWPNVGTTSICQQTPHTANALPTCWLTVGHTESIILLCCKSFFSLDKISSFAWKNWVYLKKHWNIMYVSYKRASVAIKQECIGYMSGMINSISVRNTRNSWLEVYKSLQ